MLKALSHKNIVRYINAEINPEKTGVDIILEYMPGGSIRYLLDKFACFSEDLSRIYIRQLLDGVVYLH